MARSVPRLPTPPATLLLSPDSVSAPEPPVGRVEVRGVPAQGASDTAARPPGEVGACRPSRCREEARDQTRPGFSPPPTGPPRDSHLRGLPCRTATRPSQLGAPTKATSVTRPAPSAPLGPPSARTPGFRDRDPPPICRRPGTPPGPRPHAGPLLSSEPPRPPFVCRSCVLAGAPSPAGTHVPPRCVPSLRMPPGMWQRPRKCLPGRNTQDAAGRAGWSRPELARQS